MAVLADPQIMVCTNWNQAVFAEQYRSISTVSHQVSALRVSHQSGIQLSRSSSSASQAG